MLTGIAGIDADGRRNPVHVHSKLMLVDDEWATVGSCNLHRFSLFGNSEMNVTISEPKTVRAFRVKLLEEHLDRHTSRMDDREALQLFHEIARENVENSKQEITAGKGSHSNSVQPNRLPGPGERTTHSGFVLSRIPVDKQFSLENKQLDPIILESIVYNPSGEVRHSLSGVSTDP
jgi:hypothetical protein